MRLVVVFLGILFILLSLVSFVVMKITTAIVTTFYFKPLYIYGLPAAIFVNGILLIMRKKVLIKWLYVNLAICVSFLLQEWIILLGSAVNGGIQHGWSLGKIFVFCLRYAHNFYLHPMFFTSAVIVGLIIFLKTSKAYQQLR